MKKIKCLVLAVTMLASSAQADCLSVYTEYAKLKRVESDKMVINGLAIWLVGLIFTGGFAIRYYAQAENAEETSALLKEAEVGVPGTLMTKRIAKIVKKGSRHTYPQLAEKFVALIREGNRSGLLCPEGEFRSVDDILDWAEVNSL